MKSLTDWDKRFLSLAANVATWSKEPRKKVGCVIVRPNRTIASLGYNGFPRGVTDSPNRLADRTLKNHIAIHAEMNALLTGRGGLEGFI